jgi:hypothetical protein
MFVRPLYTHEFGLHFSQMSAECSLPSRARVGLLIYVQIVDGAPISYI